jgi:16S rRNA (guanine527-N7)-methyltransferase
MLELGDVSSVADATRWGRLSTYRALKGTAKLIAPLTRRKTSRQAGCRENMNRTHVPTFRKRVTLERFSLYSHAMSHRAPQDSIEDPAGEFVTALTAALREYGIDELSDPQQAQLARHYALLRVWNRRINLTRIIAPEEAARLHYADSLAGGRFLGAAQTVLDIGSGAGFPAIPLAVLRPDVQVTALEANQKKSLFLAEAGDALRLANFKVATARLETFDLSAFDLLTSRALDRAEAVLPAVIARMTERQRFMLYGATELLGKLTARLAADFAIQTHAIPQSAARLVATFSRR